MMLLKKIKLPEKCQYCCFMQWFGWHDPNKNVWCEINNKILQTGCITEEEIDVERPEDCPLAKTKQVIMIYMLGK